MAVTTSTGLTKQAQEWSPAVVSNIQSYYCHQDQTLVLNTDEFVIDENLTFSSSSLLIYAETIRIKSSVKIPGKILGLFCNRFIVNPTLTDVSIDVSGDNATGEAKSPAANGNDAGAIVLCVEDIDDAVFPQSNSTSKTGLFLRAQGGNGGPGADSSGGGAAAQGGKGGIGGKINVYYGHKIYEEYKILKWTLDKKQSWRAKMFFVKDFKFGEHFPRQKTSEKAQMSQRTQELQRVAESYTNLLDTVSDVGKTLASVSVADAPNNEALVDLKNDAWNKIQSLLEADQEFRKADQSQLEWGTFSKELKEFASKTADKTTDEWHSLEEGLKSIARSATDMNNKMDKKSSSFEKALKLVIDAYTALTLALESDFKQVYMPAIHGGAGGHGGQKDGVQAKTGDRGGSPHGVDVQYLLFDGSGGDLDFEHALAHPEQCQMLLNRANDIYVGSYFQVDSKDAEQKSQGVWQIYNRISRRLSFVPKLIDADKNVSSGGMKALAKSYAKMDSDNLTHAYLRTMLTVKESAESSMRKLVMGQDLFGNSSAWVPRLTYTYYKTSLGISISRLDEMTKLLSNFMTQEKSNLADKVKATKAHQDECDTQITLLTQVGGPMQVAASQIASFTPVLKDHRSNLLTMIDSIKSMIQEKTNTDPKMFIDSLATTAMGHGGFNFFAQGASLTYTMKNTVHQRDGTNVEKDYVVDQFTEAGDTFSSLAEGVKNRADSSVDVTDPKCTKLLASTEKIMKLVNDFKSALDPATHAAIRAELDLYVNYVQQRNDAVIAYNAAVETLSQLRKDQDFVKKQSAELGDLILQQTPRLPAVVGFCLKKVNDLRLNCQRGLIRCHKALNFWGLRNPPFVPKQQDVASQNGTAQDGETGKSQLGSPELAAEILHDDEDALLPDAQTFQNKITDLGAMFDNCVESFASTASTDFSQHAIGVDIVDATAIKQLKQIREDKQITKTDIKPPSDPSVDDGVDVNVSQSPGPYHECVFRIKAASRGSIIPNPTKGIVGNPFFGKSDVRVSQIQVFLDGATVDANELATPADKTLHISVQHWGDDVVVNSKGVVFHFVHDHINMDWEYDIEKTVLTVIPSASDTGTVSGTGQATSLKTSQETIVGNGPSFEVHTTVESAKQWVAPFGPFANWRIRVYQNRNLNLNMEKVKRIRVRVLGTAKGFEQ